MFLRIHSKMGSEFFLIWLGWESAHIERMLGKRKWADILESEGNHTGQRWVGRPCSVGFRVKESESSVPGLVLMIERHHKYLTTSCGALSSCKYYWINDYLLLEDFFNYFFKDQKAILSLSWDPDFWWILLKRKLCMLAWRT